MLAQVAVKRSREALEENQSQRVQIGSVIRFLSTQGFRGDVAWVSPANRCANALGQAIRQAEIEETNSSRVRTGISLDEDVRGLDIAVSPARPVHGGER